MTSHVENKDGLHDLLGIPNTHLLPNDENSIMVIHVDPANTQQQILAYTKKVKELLPNNKILVLPNTVSVSYFDERWWTPEGAMIAQTLNKSATPEG